MESLDDPSKDELVDFLNNLQTFDINDPIPSIEEVEEVKQEETTPPPRPVEKLPVQRCSCGQFLTHKDDFANKYQLCKHCLHDKREGSYDYFIYQIPTCSEDL